MANTPTFADWAKLAQKDLRDTPVESLNRDYGDLPIRPAYFPEDVASGLKLKKKALNLRSLYHLCKLSAMAQELKLYAVKRWLWESLMLPAEEDRNLFPAKRLPLKRIWSCRLLVSKLMLAVLKNLKLLNGAPLLSILKRLQRIWRVSLPAEKRQQVLRLLLLLLPKEIMPPR